VLLVAALAWAAAASAHNQGWLDGPPAWRHALRPAASWTLPVLAVLWAGALTLYWWPRRHHRLSISLVALLSMVAVGVTLAEASFLPCAGGQAPVIAPQSWVLALFTGQMEERFGGAVCPGAPPLAMQLARVVCLGATFIGVAAAAAVLWRAEIDRLKTRLVGELTVMTGLDEMTVALLGRLVTEAGRGKVVLVEADPNHPLLEEARAAGARVIIADPGRAGALRPVLTHLGRPAVRQVFALHPGAHDNEAILAGVRQALRQVRRRTDHNPHVVARVDDPRHADTWRGDHIGAHQLWLEDALSPYETTAVFAVRAVSATGCGGRFPPGAPGNHRGGPGTTSMSSSARRTSARCGRSCRRPSTWDGCGARCGPSHPGPSWSSPDPSCSGSPAPSTTAGTTAASPPAGIHRGPGSGRTTAAG
jgi:hypothetical protein